MANTSFIPQDKFKMADLVKLKKQELADLVISTRERLKTANLKLALARIAIADHQKSIESKRQALDRAQKSVRSLKDTVKRRRKSHG